MGVTTETIKENNLSVEDEIHQLFLEVGRNPEKDILGNYLRSNDKAEVESKVSRYMSFLRKTLVTPIYSGFKKNALLRMMNHYLASKDIKNSLLNTPNTTIKTLDSTACSEVIDTLISTKLITRGLLTRNTYYGKIFKDGSFQEEIILQSNGSHELSKDTMFHFKYDNAKISEIYDRYRKHQEHIAQYRSIVIDFMSNISPDLNVNHDEWPEIMMSLVDEGEWKLLERALILSNREKFYLFINPSLSIKERPLVKVLRKAREIFSVSSEESKKDCTVFLRSLLDRMEENRLINFSPAEFDETVKLPKELRDVSIRFQLIDQGTHNKDRKLAFIELAQSYDKNLNKDLVKFFKAYISNNHRFNIKELTPYTMLAFDYIPWSMMFRLAWKDFFLQWFDAFKPHYNPNEQSLLYLLLTGDTTGDYVDKLDDPYIISKIKTWVTMQMPLKFVDWNNEFTDEALSKKNNAIAALRCVIKASMGYSRADLMGLIASLGHESKEKLVRHGRDVLIAMLGHHITHDNSNFRSVEGQEYITLLNSLSEDSLNYFLDGLEDPMSTMNSALKKTENENHEDNPFILKLMKYFQGKNLESSNWSTREKDLKQYIESRSTIEIDKLINENSRNTLAKLFNNDIENLVHCLKNVDMLGFSSAHFFTTALLDEKDVAELVKIEGLALKLVAVILLKECKATSQNTQVMLTELKWISNLVKRSTGMAPLTLAGVKRGTEKQFMLMLEKFPDDILHAIIALTTPESLFSHLSSLLKDHHQLLTTGEESLKSILYKMIDKTGELVRNDQELVALLDTVLIKSNAANHDIPCAPPALPHGIFKIITKKSYHEPILIEKEETSEFIDVEKTYITETMIASSIKPEITQEVIPEKIEITQPLITPEIVKIEDQSHQQDQETIRKLRFEIDRLYSEQLSNESALKICSLEEQLKAQESENTMLLTEVTQLRKQMDDVASELKELRHYKDVKSKVEKNHKSTILQLQDENQELKASAKNLHDMVKTREKVLRFTRPATNKNNQQKVIIRMPTVKVKQ